MRLEAPAPTGRLHIAPLCLGVFFVGAAVLLYEIALVRVLSVKMWYHFAYLVLALALLGLGASGSLLTWLRQRAKAAPNWSTLIFLALALGAAMVACFLITIRLPVDTLHLWSKPEHFLGLGVCFTALSVPFLLGGLLFGSALTWLPARVGTLYSANLLGSAVGGLSAPWLLTRFHTGTVVLVAGSLGLVSAAAFALGTRGRHLVTFVSPLILGILALPLLQGDGLDSSSLWTVPFAPHKIFAESFFPDGISEKSLPSATGRVDVSTPRQTSMFMASDFGLRGHPRVRLRGVTQDGTAPTALYENARSFERFSALESAQAGTAFHAHAASGRSRPEVLVVGVGGGADVMMALYFGARRVVAVDVNAAVIRMVREDYADFIGHLFDHPGVRLVSGDGRWFLNRTDATFDIIQLSGVDTYTALSSGAYTLSESYLYTVEALGEMYRRVNEGGFINFSRLVLTAPEARPRETLRLANTARASLERAGVAEPWRNIVVFQGISWASTIVRKGPFTEREIGALRDFAEQENFQGLLFDPLRPRDHPQDNSRKLFLTRLSSELLPTRRDEHHLGPLFEKALRAAAQGDTARSDAWLDLAAEISGLSSTVALAARRDETLERLDRELRHRREVLALFDTVLRGTDSQRQVLVDQYFYDLQPTWDDKPFFFNYFRIGQLLTTPPGEAWYRGSEAVPGFPVGHMVLISSLGMILVLSGALILLPLKSVPKASAPTGTRLRIFAYFAALGCGFMLVEITLMQRFTLLLGHPTYALTVVLSGMLFFAGLGSLTSSRLPGLSFPGRWLLAGAILGVLIGARPVLDALAPWLIALEGPWRFSATLALVAPVGLLLGVPFPWGIRLLQEKAPSLIPWSWGVNGFASVTGSVVAVILAMAFGFSRVLLVAGMTYALGFAAIPTASRDRIP